ncbi:hypothetical protein Tco_0293364, partial [Tanacetum coccineum]
AHGLLFLLFSRGSKGYSHILQPSFLDLHTSFSRTLSSPDHPISNLEDVFSSNFLNYVPPASPDYVPTSPGKTYSSASNLFGIVSLTSSTLSFFPDDPYMKALQAFYTKKSPIPSPIIIPPKTQEFFLPEGLRLSPMLLRLVKLPGNQLSNVMKSKFRVSKVKVVKPKNLNKC